LKFRKARTKPYDIGSLIVPLSNSIPIFNRPDYFSRRVGFWTCGSTGIVLESNPEERQIKVLVGDQTGWIAMDLVKEVDEDEEEIWGNC